MPNLWNITLNMTLTDGGVVVVDKDYSISYRDGDSIAAKKNMLVARMQGDIDKYKSEQGIYTMPALDTAVMDISAALVV